MKGHGGNGEPKLKIAVDNMGGWLRVFVEAGSIPYKEPPLFLSQSLTDWLRQHPQCVLKCVVPITEDGQTVELHAWYDVHVLPPPESGT